MAVLAAANGPDDRRPGRVIAVDDGAHGGGRKQRRIDQREQHRLDLGPVDRVQAGEQRRELAVVEAGVDDESGRQARRGRQCSDDRVRLIAQDDGHVGDQRFVEGPDDAREKRVAVVDWQGGFEASHAG